MGDKNNYAKEWRKKNPHKWHLIQLKWYYKNRIRILAGWRKPKGAEQDAFDIHQLAHDLAV